MPKKRRKKKTNLSLLDKGGDFVDGKKDKPKKSGSSLLDKGSDFTHGKKHSKKKAKKRADTPVQKAVKTALKTADRQVIKASNRYAKATKSPEVSINTSTPDLAVPAKAIEEAKLEQLGRDLGYRTTGTEIADAIAGTVVQGAEIGTMITPGGFGRKAIKEVAEQIAKGGVGKGTKAASKALPKKPPKSEARRIKKTTSDVRGSSKIGKNRRIKEDTKKTIAAEKQVYGKSATEKAVKSARRTQRIKGAGAAGTLAAPMAPVVAPIVSRTAEATYEDPGAVLKTTGRALPSLVTAPVGTAKAIAEGNWGQVEQEFRDYSTMLETLSAGDKEEAIKMVQEDVGLIPAGSLALSLYGIGKLGAGGRPNATAPKPAGPLTRRRQRKALEGDKAAQDALAGQKTPVRDREGRVTVAREQSRFEHTGQALAEGDLKSGKLGKNVRNAEGRQIGKVQTGTTPDGRPIVKKVTIADAIPVLAKFTIALDRKLGGEQARRLVKQMEEARRPDDVTNPARLSQLDVLRAIAENPAILENKALAKALTARSASSVDVSRTRAALSGEDGSTPLAKDERARYVPMARMLDERTPEERIPKALEGVTNVKPKKYQDAKAAIRGEVSTLRRKANKLLAQSRALKKSDPEKAARLATQYEQTRARISLLQGEVNRLRRADAMDKLATRMENGQPVPKQYRDLDPSELRQAAQVLRQEAKTLRDEHLRADSELNREFVGDMQSRLAEEGFRTDPFYVKSEDARDFPSTAGNEGMVHADLTPAEKMMTGSLSERGLEVAEAGQFLKGIVEQRINQAQIMFGRSLLENPKLTKVDPSGKPLIYTSEEFAKALQEGDLPPGFSKISVQEMNKLFQFGRWEEARGALDSPFHQALREARGKEGHKYFAVQKGALKEFKKQGEELGAGYKALRVVGAAQSIALLGLSPAWFIYQLMASPLVMFARHPNVLTYPAAAARMVKRYRGSDKATREVFNGMYGAGQSNIFDNLRGNPGISSNKKIVSQMADAQALARSSWAGRFVKGFTGNLRRGGPLIAMNRKYEAFLREFDAMLEIDKMIRQERHPEFHRFAKSVSQLDDYNGQLIAKLKGKDQAEVERFFTQNGVARRELGRRVDDAMGNWTALTSNERRAATAMIFYPFLRFSLRWTAYAFPKNNPAKAIALANLAAINAIELEEMNGDEDLGFFSDYGKVHVPGSNEVLNLGRIAPASNAYIEAGMGERGPLQSAFAGTQPLVGSIFSALANEDPFTGKPLPMNEEMGGILDPEMWATVGKDMASLATPARPLIDPPSPFSTLLRAVRGQSTDPYTQSMVPKLGTDADREMEAQRIGRLMGVAFDPLYDSFGKKLTWTGDVERLPATPDKLNLIRKFNEKMRAQDELRDQFEKWGIPVPDGLDRNEKADWPIGGKNETTIEIPNRDIYLDEKKKKRWYDSGKQYGGGGPDPLGLGTLSDSDPLGLGSSTDDPLDLGF